jgi:hypothetical protein
MKVIHLDTKNPPFSKLKFRILALQTLIIKNWGRFIGMVRKT